MVRQETWSYSKWCVFNDRASQ